MSCTSQQRSARAIASRSRRKRITWWMVVSSWNTTPPFGGTGSEASEDVFDGGVADEGEEPGEEDEDGIGDGLGHGLGHGNGHVLGQGIGHGGGHGRGHGLGRGDGEVSVSDQSCGLGCFVSECGHV